jgi:hypothetical protein
MKILCSLLLVPALLLCAPAARAQKPTFEELETGCDALAQELAATVAYESSPAQVLDELELALAARNEAAQTVFPQGCRARARLQAVLANLIARARSAQLYADDVEQFVEEVAEARMDEELSAIDELVATGRLLSRERYLHMVSLVRRIAAREIQLAQAPDLSTRLLTALENLRAAAAQSLATLAHVHAIRALLVEERVQRYLSLLQQQVGAGRMSREDYHLFEQRLIERQDFALGLLSDPCG